MSVSETNYQFAIPHKILPRPDWVHDISAEDVEVADYESPFVYTLVDYQIRALEGSVTSFQRTKVKISDESAIESMSQHLYDVVPGSQTIEFHRCEITRNGKTIDCLDADNIRCMQRETALESHVSTENLTVELIVDDLRVGDTLHLETSFVETENEHPLYGKYFRDSYRLSWSCFVALQSIRVSNESTKEIAIQHIDSAKKIDKTDFLAPGASFEDQWHNLLPKKQGHSMPAHYWPPYVMVSSKAEWQTISSYMHSYYSNVGATNEKLELSNIDDLNIAGASDESIISCIRFVQDNIRYRSESGGIFSHTPKTAAKTLKRRTGDCKDKSNLLVTMLSGLGVQANLALVNTSLRDGVESLQPSPFLFNHMIVQFMWKDKIYFVDATIQKQAGGLEQLSVLNFKKALPITASGSGLADLYFDNTKEVFSLIHTVDFRSSENEKPTVEILRKYSRQRANNMRYFFASSQMSLLEESYLDSTASELDVKLTSVSSLSIVEDDLISNTLSTREVYQIETPLDDIKNGRLAVETNFHEDLHIPDTNRNPVEIELDGILNHQINVRYDNKPDADGEKFECTTDWYLYKDKVTRTGNDLHFEMTLHPGSKEIVQLAQMDALRVKTDSISARSMSGFPVQLLSTSTLLYYLALPALVLFLGVAIMSQRYFLAATLGLSSLYLLKDFIGTKK